MNRNVERALWLGVVLQAAGLLVDAVLLAGAGAAVARLTFPFTAGGLLVCLAAAWHERLSQKAREEALDSAAESSAGKSLFAADAEALAPFGAARQLKQYERFLAPFIPFILAAVAGGGAVWLAAAVRWAAETPPGGPLAAGFLGGRAFAVFLIHRLLLTIGRQRAMNNVRAAAIWLGLTALAACFSAIIILIEAWADIALAYPAMTAAAVISGLLGVEALFMGIAACYRSQSHRSRLPASRLGALLCDPAAWAHSLAGAMDYQFGFRISETRMYRFARRMAAPMLVMQLLLLWLSHCLIVLEPHEAALLEVMGKPARILQSGHHVVLPPPLHRVRRYPMHRVQRLQTGFEHHANGEHRHDILLWSVEHHHHEHDFLVAARDIEQFVEILPRENAVGAAPVNLLSISMTVDYKVTDLLRYLTVYSDPAQLLRHTASRLLMLEAVNADVFDLMGTGQRDFAGRIASRLQKKIHALDLGMEIQGVNLHGIHPPVAVAAAFETVIGADEIHEAALLEGKAYRIHRLPAARAEAYARLQEAAASRETMAATAAAGAVLFENRSRAAGMIPAVYPLRSMLDVMEKHLSKAGLHVVGAVTDAEVIEIDLTEKPYSTLLDAAGRLSTADPRD